MTNYIPADKLIAEIERLSATEYGGNTLGDDVANGALDYVLEEIIPSLQQEQPEVDLEKEIDRELDTRWKGEYLSTSKFRESARHFAKWGAIHLNTRKRKNYDI